MRPETSEGESTEVPWDGVTSGEIEIRGPWVAASYHESPDQAHRWTADGWFRTGDGRHHGRRRLREDCRSRKRLGEIGRRVDQFPSISKTR